MPRRACDLGMRYDPTTWSMYLVLPNEYNAECDAPAIVLTMYEIIIDGVM